MKIILAGGSGQIGSILSRAFCKDGHEVVILSRNPKDGTCRSVYWDGNNQGRWTQELEGAGVVVNLAGRCVNCRYDSENRRKIMASRVNATRAIGTALQNAENPTQLWLQAGTSTIYANRYDAPNDELTGIIGGNEKDIPATWTFSTDVAKAWEQACNDFHLPKTRKIIMRASMTMSPDHGGVFHVLSSLVRAGLGGRAGDGKQYVSWIHQQDFVNAIYHLIERRDLEGVFNFTAPEPLPNRQFMRILRKAWGVSVGVPASRWMLEVGAIFMRTESELVLKSRRVAPTRLLESGFEFTFPNWGGAAEDLVARAKTRNQEPALVAAETPPN